MCAPPIFNNFLSPVSWIWLKGQFSRIIWKSLRILKVNALILVLELWKVLRVTLVNSRTQTLPSFSKILEVREREWEFSRVEVSFGIPTRYHYICNSFYPLFPCFWIGKFSWKEIAQIFKSVAAQLGSPCLKPLHCEHKSKYLFIPTPKLQLDMTYIQGVLAYHDFVYHEFCLSRIFLKGFKQLFATI